MNRFSSLIKKEFDKVEKRNFTDVALENLCHKIDWAMRIKYTFFPLLKDAIDNKKVFIAIVKDFNGLPDFYSSSQMDEFYDFLFEIAKAIKADKEEKARKDKISRLKKLKEEIKTLEEEIYLKEN